MAAPQHPSLFTFGTADMAAQPFDFTALVASSAMASNPFGFHDHSLSAFQLDSDVGALPVTKKEGNSTAKEIQDGPRVMASKTFDEDFMNLPFDLSAADSGPLPSFNTFAFPFATSSDTSNLPPLPALNTNPLALDRGLESPLGLEQDSPYSEFLASPMFGEDAGELPPPLDYDYPSLFPTSTNTRAPAPPALAPLSTLDTALRPNPIPPHLTHSPFPSSAASTPALTPSLPHLPGPSVASTSASARPRATGFRGASTPLVAMDAPIQPRQYVLPSTTSRKRKTTAVERELAKRGRSTPAPASETVADPVAEDAIPSDLVAAVERKRLQNTLAARKSRQRKQERLGELEERNRVLEEENLGLKSRVDELESMLRSMGIAV